MAHTADANDLPYAMLLRAMSRLKPDEIEMRHEFMCGLISLLQSEGFQMVLKVKEDVFLATSTTISSLSLDELKVHLPALINYFKSAVDLPDSGPMVVSLMGDLFRALGTESLPYLDGFCLKVFDLLEPKEVATNLRANCFATLIDMANSVGMQNFQPYIARTLNQLEYASSITVKKVSFFKFILQFFNACHFFFFFWLYSGSRT